MADNVAITPGAGANIAADDIGGVLYQRFKLSLGADGAAADLAPGQAAMAASVPVAIASDQSAVPVSATGLTSLAAAIKAEDAAAADGESGIAILAVRRDADTSGAGADGDYAHLYVDEQGRLKVAAQPASYPIVTGSITANAQTVFASVARISNVVAHMVATSLVGHNCTFEASIDSTDGSNGAWFAIQALRSNANVIDLTTGVLAATPVYAWELSVNAYSYVRVRATAHTSGTALWKFQPGSYATEPIPAAQVSGTQPVSGSVTATGIAGAAAHDAVISGNPVRLAGRALTANYAAVATGDTADLVTTLAGALVTRPYAIPELDWAYAAGAAGILNTTTAVTIKAAAGAGVRNYITGLQVMSEVLTNATELAVRDGAAGAVLWRTKIPTGGLPSMNIAFASPLRGTANTLLEVVTLTASGAGAVYVNAQGFAAP
jgi:hypothetical protein